MHPKAAKLKQKLLQEMRSFLLYTAFIALFFFSLLTYQNLTLGAYSAEHLSLNYLHYSYELLQAAILSKIILLGENLKLGEKFADKPLIVPTLYKTLSFSLFVFFFTTLEHLFFGFLRGISFVEIYQVFLSKGINVVLAKVWIVFFVFIFFFAFLEMGRVFGERSLFDLFFFFRKPKSEADISENLDSK